MWKQLLSQPLTFLPCILLSIQLPHNKLLMVLSSLIRFCFDGGESKRSYRPSNLNTLYVWHFYVSPLSKNVKTSFGLESSKNTFGQGYPAAFFSSFWSSRVPFFEICCPLCSFIYYHNLVFLFVSLDSASSLIYYLGHVWSYFLLVVAMFVKGIYTIYMQLWCHVQCNNRCLGTDQHIDFGNSLFWRTC